MPKGRAIIPCTGTVVSQAPIGINGFQVPANWVHNMFHLTRKPKGRIPHLKDVCLPDPISCSVAKCRCEIAAKNGGFWQFGMASLDRVQNTRIPGTTGAAGHLQRCKTARPTVSIYLDELPA